MIVQLRAVFRPSVQYLLLFCEVFSWMTLVSSRFPLFHSGQVFHQLVCPLTVVLPRIFFNLTTLFFYPVFFSLFRAPPDVVVYFLYFLRSLRLIFFSFWVLSFCRTDQELLQWSRVFVFWRWLPRISLAVSVTAVLKVMIIESMSVSLLLMTVRGANLPPIIAWKVSISTELSPDRHRGWPPHTSQRSGGCSTITEEREVSWSRQHPSRTGPSRWRGYNHRSHDNLQQDLADRRMANPVDPVLSRHTSQERQLAAVPKLPNDQPYHSPQAKSCWRSYWADWSHKRRRSSP